MPEQKFHLSCDSSIDEFKSSLAKNNISYYPMVYIHDDIEEEDRFDSEKDYKDFFDKVRNGTVYSTAGISEFKAQEYFKELLNRFNSDVIHIALSSGLSETCNYCKLAAEKINQTSKHKVYVVDSCSATRAQFFILNIAKDLRDQGKTAQEAFEKIEKEKNCIKTFFYVPDLKYLKRGGRISGVAATVGTLLQMKPLIKFDSEGRLVNYEKVIGAKKANMHLAEQIFKLHDFNGRYPVVLAHADNNEGVNELIELIKAKKPDAKFDVGYVGPVIGSHTGPGLVGCLIYCPENK